MSEYAVMPLADYKGACDLIRSVTDKTDLITSGQFEDALREAIERYRNLFWNVFLVEGKRTNFKSAFDASGTNLWSWEIITPTYDLVPTNAQSMFRGVSVGSLGSIDLVEWFNKLGVKLDFSQCVNVQYCLRDARNITHLGVLDFRAATNISGFAYSSQSKNEIETIDELIFALGADLAGCLMFCTSLTHCIFKADSPGSITTSQNFSYQKFDAESVRSIFDYMQTYAGTVTEFQRTLTLTETAWANVNADTDNLPPSGETWQEYAQIIGWSYAEAEG